MRDVVTFCDTPEQSAAVGVAAGVIGGVAGLWVGLGTQGVVAVAGGLALAGDLGVHVLRGDEQFVAAGEHIRRLARRGR